MLMFGKSNRSGLMLSTGRNISSQYWHKHLALQLDRAIGQTTGNNVVADIIIFVSPAPAPHQQYEIHLLNSCYVYMFMVHIPF